MNVYSDCEIDQIQRFGFYQQYTAVKAQEDEFDIVCLGVGAMMPNDLPVLMLCEMAQLV
ncbi:MAG: hypothetical protein ACO1N8_03410 [Methylophilus sp.]